MKEEITNHYLENSKERKNRILQIKNVSKEFGNEKLFDNIDLTLSENEKKALVGPNGSGKTTLLKMIAGIERPDTGDIDLGSLRVEYLPQELSIQEDLDSNIIDYLKEKTGIDKIREKMEQLEEDLSDNKKLKEYGEIREMYEKAGGYSFRNKAKRMLSFFNLDKNLDEDIKKLSGGQRSKLALAGILLKKPDILLLDEPTNNLDLPSLIWLEQFIKENKMACLIVSHDREFLDNVVEGVVQIDPNKKNIIEESGDYTDFIERRKKELERKKETYQKIEEKINDLKKISHKKKEWGKKGRKQEVGGKDKYLRGYLRDRSSKNLGKEGRVIDKRIDVLKKKAEKPENKKPLNINIESSEALYKNAIQLNELKAGYKDSFSLDSINMRINYGEKIVLIGNNASGKTTFLKTIAGDIKPISGELNIGKDLSIGNFRQHHDHLPLEKTCFDYLKDDSNLAKHDIYRTLDYFNLSIDYADKKISKLSLGQRVRLILAKFSVKKVNTLILDEPTNHLDIESINALEETLKNYKGTIIMASHDRSFIKNIEPDSFYLIKDNKINFLSDYDDYIESIKERSKRYI